MIWFFLKFSFFLISILLISPPQIFFINSDAFNKPNSIDSGSIPLSNLYFASVSIFNNFEVFLIYLGSKYADSNNIFFVLNSVPDLIPPIIPPKPKTPELSDITHISSLSA